MDHLNGHSYLSRQKVNITYNINEIRENETVTLSHIGHVFLGFLQKNFDFSFIVKLQVLVF